MLEKIFFSADWHEKLKGAVKAIFLWARLSSLVQFDF